jgi:uncharacterized membrane protein YbhN (UPF0104 family)
VIPSPEQETVVQRRISIRRWLTLLIGVALGAAFLALAVRDVSWEVARSSLQRVNVGWLSLATVGVVLVAVIKSERWRWLFFPRHRSVTPLDVLAVTLLGQVVNILLPVRLGEVLRVGLLARSTDLRVTATIGTIVVEKLVDTLVLAAMALLLAPALISLTGQTPSSPGLFLASLAALVGGVLILSRRQVVSAWLRNAVGRWPGGRWLAAKLDLSLSSLDLLQHRQAWQALGGWTALAWFLSILNIFITFAAFDLSVPPTAAFLIVILIHLGLVLPKAPGMVGLIQYVSVLVLTHYGVERSIAFGYGLVLHLLLVVPLVVLAAWGWYRSRSRRAQNGWINQALADQEIQTEYRT